MYDFDMLIYYIRFLEVFAALGGIGVVVGGVFLVRWIWKKIK